VKSGVLDEKFCYGKKAATVIAKNIARYSKPERSPEIFSQGYRRGIYGTY
jgi:hypothetical protein